MFFFRHKPRRRHRVEHKPGGYKGWQDETSFRRPNLFKLFTAGCLMFFICSGLFAVTGFILGNVLGGEPGQAVQPLGGLTMTTAPEVTFVWTAPPTETAMPTNTQPPQATAAPVVITVIVPVVVTEQIVITQEVTRAIVLEQWRVITATPQGLP